MAALHMFTALVDEIRNLESKIFDLREEDLLQYEI